LGREPIHMVGLDSVNYRRGQHWINFWGQGKCVICWSYPKKIHSVNEKERQYLETTPEKGIYIIHTYFFQKKRTKSLTVFENYKWSRLYQNNSRKCPKSFSWILLNTYILYPYPRPFFLDSVQYCVCSKLLVKKYSENFVIIIPWNHHSKN
jgi:hypothetical protein